MYKILIFLCSLLFACQVQAANLDAKIGVFSDLHHSQTEDNVTNSVVPMLALIDQMEPGITNWLGLGDLIDSSYLELGPYSANDADIQAPFLASGRTIKTVTGNHDRSAGTPVAPLFPGSTWTWDIGSKWRIVAMEAMDNPGESFSPAKLTWLAEQRDLAIADGKFVIPATHFQVGTTKTIPTQVVTPSATTGTVTITSNAAGTFSSSLVAQNQRIYLRHGTCNDASCWGWGGMVGCDGGATCTTGTSVTVQVAEPFKGTGAADEWGYFGILDMAPNSAEVRAILEAPGSTVKLGLSGHTHRTGKWTVNGIDYVSIVSARNTGGAYGIARSGGILYLYDDGTWKLRGTGMQPSYNWSEFYYDPASGDDGLNGGTAPYDAWKTWAKIEPSLTAGVTARLKSDLTGNITLNGSAGSLIGIKAADGVRPKITGNIAGSYLDIDGVDLNISNTFSATNSTVKRVMVK